MKPKKMLSLKQQQNLQSYKPCHISGIDAFLYTTQEAVFESF